MTYKIKYKNEQVQVQAREHKTRYKHELYVRDTVSIGAQVIRVREDMSV